MQVTAEKETCWVVTTPYDGSLENHSQSQNRFISEFCRLNGWDKYKELQWFMGTGNISHHWYVFDEEAAFNFMLAYGSEIKKTEATRRVK